MPKLSTIHPFLFAIFPIILLYSQNIHLLPIEEIIIPILLVVGLSTISWIILNYFLRNLLKAGLIVSLFLVVFFSYGHVYNILDDVSFLGFDIGRHIFLLIPFFVVLVLGIIYLLKTKRKLNNLSSVVNVISITAVLIIAVNVVADISQENYFGSQKLGMDEKFLGVGASKQPFLEILSPPNENKYTTSNVSTAKSDMPDIYYIILDEYSSNHALKKFFDYDNLQFLSYLKEKGFFVVSPSYTNYPTTVQSLGSSLNMDYINYLSEEAGIDSKNYHLLNDILSRNKVMEILQMNQYNVINMGALWGPNNEFQNVNANLCEFKEFNRDSLMRELQHITMLSYLQEKLVEEGRRDRVLCVFDELPILNQKFSSPKFVFVHVMLPHAPYIFGPNGEDVNPGISLDGKPWDPKKAHIDQLKFANKKIRVLIETLLSQNNNSIMIIQGDTGSAFSGDWDNPSEDLIIERMSNLNAIYFPNGNYEAFSEYITPVNSFRIIFNEFFDANYTLLEDNMYWSTGSQPYAHKDVTNLLLKDNEI